MYISVLNNKTDIPYYKKIRYGIYAGKTSTHIYVHTFVLIDNDWNLSFFNIVYTPALLFRQTVSISEPRRKVFPETPDLLLYTCTISFVLKFFGGNM